LADLDGHCGAVPAEHVALAMQLRVDLRRGLRRSAA
jgi:hypothetical protein